MGGLLTRLKTWWETADRTQKAVTVFGSVFLVLLLAGTFYFASRPHMALAFSNLDSAEVGSVTSEIEKLGIPVQYNDSGDVQVPADKVAEVHAKLALAGKLPTPGHLGDSLMQIGPTTTDGVEKERIKNIQQNDLAAAIEDIKGISKANVQLNLGDASAFADENKPASASVEVTLGPNATMGPGEGRAIAMLVSNSVVGLSPDKVFVLDNSGKPLYDPSRGSDGSSGNEKISQEIAEKNRRQEELQEQLDRAFGRNNTQVLVNLELNYDKKSEEDDTHPPAKSPSEKETQDETMSGDAGGLVGGLAGAVSNGVTPTTPPPPTPGKKYENKSTTEVHPVDEKHVTTEVAVGGLKSMSIAAMVNSTPLGADGKPVVVDPKSVQSFLDDYLKNFSQTDSQHFVAHVTTAPFDMSAKLVAQADQKAEAARDRMQQIISMLPIAALIFVGFLVAKAIGKAAKPVMVGALPGGGTLALEDGYEDGQSMLDRHYEHGEGHPHPEEEPQEEIAQIQEKLNLPLEQLKRMSDEKSESVAMLMKSWILEDHK